MFMTMCMKEFIVNPGISERSGALSVDSRGGRQVQTGLRVG